MAPVKFLYVQIYGTSFDDIHINFDYFYVLTGAQNIRKTY